MVGNILCIYNDSTYNSECKLCTYNVITGRYVHTRNCKGRQTQFQRIVATSVARVHSTYKLCIHHKTFTFSRTQAHMPMPHIRTMSTLHSMQSTDTIS